MARFGSLTAALLLLPSVVRAEIPSPEYFTGLYERVGRDDAGGLVNDLVRLDPQGEALLLSSCNAQGEPLSVTLRFEPMFEVENILSGSLGQSTLWCQFHNDGQNYAILNCATDAGARFTLWPQGSGPGCVPE
jgi:hypothetical protein